jgi:uncharacterized protein with HEPN domain
MSESIASISQFLNEINKEQFLSNYMLQLAITKLLENIDESANRITPDLKEEYKEIDWAVIVRSRNVYVHQYFALDLETIWETATADLKPLKSKIDHILIKKFSFQLIELSNRKVLK